MILKTRETINNIKGLKLVIYSNIFSFFNDNIEIGNALQECDINYKTIIVKHSMIAGDYPGSDDSNIIKMFIIPEDYTEENVEKIYSYFFLNELKKD